MRSVVAAIVAAGGLPGPVRAAQLPDAAARADTVYSLAVDSTAYREYPFVFLVNDGSARFEPDGRGVRTFHQVIQILKPDGVAPWAERSFNYSPARETLVVNWMRVVRPSGEVVSDKPAQSQSADVPAAIADPVYTDAKVLRYSLSNVAPGTIVDVSWTVETINPPMPGDLLAGWSMSMPVLDRRSRFVLDVPASYAPRIIEEHLQRPRADTVANGRHRYLWSAEEVRPPRVELFAPDSSVAVMAVRVGAPIGWNDIGRWYNGLAKDRYSLTPALVRTVDSVVRGARTPADTLTALHQWIAKDLRYVSIALGAGGYQPRSPEVTVSTGVGDCKDKATLFIAAARHLGIVAYPVLLNSNGKADRDLPAIEQFNHVIAAIESRNHADFTYVDLTTFAYPVGQLPPSYQGAFGLVVLPGNVTREITFPRDPAGEVEQRFEGELLPDGRVNGVLSIIPRGSAEASMRALYAAAPDSARRASWARTAPRPFPGATVDTVVFPDARNRAVPPIVAITLRGGEGAKPAGTMMILSIPPLFRGVGPGFRTVLAELQRAGARRLPIDPVRAFGTRGARQELRLQLPAGWTAQLPPSVNTSGPFGSYQADYTQVGRELRIVHALSGATELQPPERMAQFIEWMQKIVKDDAEFIPISRP